MMVMMMAITPSLKASSRFLGMGRFACGLRSTQRSRSQRSIVRYSNRDGPHAASRFPHRHRLLLRRHRLPCKRLQRRRLAQVPAEEQELRDLAEPHLAAYARVPAHRMRLVGVAVEEGAPQRLGPQL